MAPCAVAGGAETRTNPQEPRPAAARLLSLIGWCATRHPPVRGLTRPAEPVVRDGLMVRIRLDPKPRAAAKGSHEEVSGTRTQRTEPWRARPGFGYRQDPTGTLSGVPQRSPEPYRHRSAAPSPCRTDSGARRQAVCDIARGTGDRLSRNSPTATSMSN
jgi:hypothetical protein